MRKRGRSDKNQAGIVAALRKAGRTVVVLSGQGDGCPDLVVGCNGHNYLLECKVIKGELTPDQLKFETEWRGQVDIVRTAEEAIQATNPLNLDELFSI